MKFYKPQARLENILPSELLSAVVNNYFEQINDDEWNGAIIAQ